MKAPNAYHREARLIGSIVLFTRKIKDSDSVDKNAIELLNSLLSY